MAAVTIEKLTVRFGDFTAVDAIDLDIADGEFVVFLGPSGCGKTTTLRCVAGLENATSGRILFDGRPVGHLDAVDRNVAMVFQFVSLYPHLTVRKNIAFPLVARGTQRSEIEKKIEWVTRIFDLGQILDQKPVRLPPGARQKAALARAVVRSPNVLLLDEPLSAIDEQFREEMRWELRHLQKQLGVTSIFVTHDQREAMSLADRIVLMRDGRIVQVGRPSEMFEDPADAFAGFFIGSPAMNFIPVVRAGAAWRLPDGGEIRLPERLVAGVGDREVRLGIRPHHVFAGADPAEPGCFAATSVGTSAVGRERWFDFALGTETFRGVAAEGHPAGSSPVVVRLDLDNLHLFRPDGSRVRAGGTR
jgi:ABC-type sugar transport system ATPase subunit